MKKIRYIGFGVLFGLWAALVLGSWFGPSKESSEAERRPLAQLPEITGKALLSGDFMEDFEDYSLDQFPLRDTFRQIKSLFHDHALNQSDNNGIYIADGFAVKQEYPLSQASLNHALERFEHIYDKYLKNSGSRVVASVVPDKGYYLAEASGHLAMDYEALFAAVEDGMPWAEFVDITDCLKGSDYYRTDTHWRQEYLAEAAEKLCEALEAAAFESGELTPEKVERPFYGVYYGQAALPMDAEDMYILKNSLLENCTVYDHETGATGSIYDMSKLESRDLYDVYLSGARALLTIENPEGIEGRELIVFRDSFGSSMVPLLLKDYRTVTVVDIRYIASDLLDSFVDYHGQDVLFLYSTLVLNSSSSLK